MLYTRIIKKIFFIFLAFIFLSAIFILFQERFLEFKYLVGYSLSSQYKKDKELIKPYFNEKFYLNNYGEAVKKSGLKPIDHFLKKGWYSNNWRNNTDPNSWFNTTLYQDRLWGDKPKDDNLIHYLTNIFKIRTNPFVNFLRQPKLKDHHETVEVWSKNDELARAWLAAEGLMRLDRFNVVLHIPSDVKIGDKIRFEPQIKRGLKLLPDNEQEKSFYKSDFIKNPDKYNLSELKPGQKTYCGEPISYIKQDFDYLFHQLYPCADWAGTGKINPTMINIAYYHAEPLLYSSFFNNLYQKLDIFLKGTLGGGLDNMYKLRTQNFKDYLVRIAEGFDLYILNTKLPVPNLKIIPGNIALWVDARELSKEKEFSVSFLLTNKNKERGGRKYGLRNEVWKREKEFKIPTRFYLSYRDKDQWPKNLQDKVMPTDSKKWVFNSEFNIAIENVIQKDHFTEKLLDCFASLTIPIYIGCPNIADYFDTRGMIIAESANELIEKTNSLTPETYKKMLPYLQENRERTLKLLNREKEIMDGFRKKIYPDIH